MAPLILASGSPVRRRLLSDAGLVFTVDVADVEEERGETETPWQMADRLAADKALAVSARQPGALVIGSDQVGQTEDDVELRKCWSEETALAQLCAMAGRKHTFRSAAAIAVDSVVRARVAEEATVTFRAFSADDARAYLQTQQWRGSAGSYTLEGRGVNFIEHVEGSQHAILGLPLVPLLGALRELR